jgi:hypothetical protein
MMQKPPDESLDLQSLLSAADKHIEQAGERRAHKKPTALGSFLAAHWLQLLLVMLALVVLFAHGAELRRQIFGVPQAAKHRQAEGVLNAARTAVEQYRKTNGSLPDRVPLSALDAMVSLEQSDGKYQLTMVLAGKTWQMDQQGIFSGGEQ